MFLVLLFCSVASMQITPLLGPAGGGTAVQVTGEAFLPEKTLTCYVGSGKMTSVTMIRSKTVTGVTPAGSGVKEVKCSNDGVTFPFPSTQFE